MTRFFKSCYQSLLVPLGLLYWAVAGLIITVVGAVFYNILPPKFSRPCGCFLLQKAFLFFIAYLKISRFIYLDDSALIKLAKYQGAAIIAPNHIALWDAVFIIAKIPKVVCIIKGSILKNPFLGGGARLAGYIANDSSKQMIRVTSRQLLQGEKVLLFPEGTRTKSDAQWLNSFQRVTVLIAKRTHVPIFPVYIRSNSRFYEKGWGLFKKPVFPVRISFEVGDAIYFTKNENVQTFTQKLQQSYIKALASPHPLRRKPHSGL